MHAIFLEKSQSKRPFDNVPPDVTGSLTLPSLLVNTQPDPLTLAGLFEDRNGDELTFSAFADDLNEPGEEADEDVVAVDIDDQNQLVIEPIGIGAATDGIGDAMITIVATDPDGASNMYSGTLTVIEGIGRNEPVISDFEMARYSPCLADVRLNMEDVFIYRDPSLLTYNIPNFSASTVGITLVPGQENVIDVTLKEPGASFITIKATDSDADLEEEVTLGFSIVDGITANSTVQADLLNGYITNRSYSLALVDLGLFEAEDLANPTFSMSGVMLANNVINVTQGLGSNLGFNTLGRSWV